MSMQRVQVRRAGLRVRDSRVAGGRASVLSNMVTVIRCVSWSLVFEMHLSVGQCCSFAFLVAL